MTAHSGNLRKWSILVNDYYDDEYDEFDDDGGWDDYEPSIAETSVYIYVYKGKSGHVALLEVSGYKYHGQDWGETSGQWHERYVNLNTLYEDVKAAALKQAKTMQPGETEHFYFDETDDDYEGYAALEDTSDADRPVGGWDWEIKGGWPPPGLGLSDL